MKSIFFCSALLLLISCEPSFITYRMNLSLDFADKQGGQIFTYEDSFDIIQYGKFCIYHSIDINPQNNNTATNDFVKSRKRYYVFETNQKKGLYYVETQLMNGQLFDVDSLLLKSRNGADKLLDKQNDKLLSTEKLTNGSVKETYTCTKIDASYPDSIYVFYDRRLKNSIFSFSSTYDSLQDSKLSRIKIIYNSYHDINLNVKVNRRVYSYRLTKLEQQEPKQVVSSILDAYKKERKRLHQHQP